MDRTPPDFGIAQSPVSDIAPAGTVPVPAYLQRVYWWTYIHPFAVWVFDRQWVVNLILLTQYNRMRREALKEIGLQEGGTVLQLSCAYGDLIPKLADRVLAGQGALDIVDVLPVQLKNIRRKLPLSPRIRYLHMNGAALRLPSGHYDKVMLFFLLHETPADVRTGVLEEALRVLKPGGKLIISDFAMPKRWNPFRYLWAIFLSIFEPFALDMWRTEIEGHLPSFARHFPRRQNRYFGALFQKTVITRPQA